jgi:hypothetical protein
MDAKPMRKLSSRQIKLIIGSAVVLVAILVVVGTLWARPTEDKTAKIQPDWSRGMRLGKMPWNQPPVICASDDGQRIHIAWPGNSPAGPAVYYVQLDKDARQVAKQWSAALQGTPRSVQMLLDDQGRPHIFVMARMPGETALRLVHWALNADGTQRASVQPLSPPGVEVESYAVTAGREGALHVFWSADPESDTRGLYHMRLDTDSQAIADDRRLNERPVRQVSVQADHNGNVHVIWGEDFSGPTSDTWYRVMYATFSDGALQPAEGTFVAQVDAPSRLGLGDQRAYIFWGKEVKGGMRGGTASSAYATFPLDQPAPASSADLSVPADSSSPYQAYQGEYKFKNLASATQTKYTEMTDYVNSPAPLAGQHSDVAVATVAAIWFGGNERIVPTLILLRDEQTVGYQVIGYNDGRNAQPAIAADASGNLYAAWLTGSTSAGFGVYYAATTASARAHLDGKDLTDLMVGAVTITWHMLGGFALLPLFPLIVLPAIVIVVAYSAFGQGGAALGDRRSYIVLVVSCLVYWLAKEIILGGVVAEPVLAQGLVGWSRTLVIWAIQLAIAAVAGWIAWRVTMHQWMDSIFWCVLTFIACDMLLTMLAAGPTLAVRG